MCVRMPDIERRTSKVKTKSPSSRGAFLIVSRTITLVLQHTSCAFHQARCTPPAFVSCLAHLTRRLLLHAHTASRLQQNKKPLITRGFYVSRIKQCCYIRAPTRSRAAAFSHRHVPVLLHSRTDTLPRSRVPVPLSRYEHLSGSTVEHTGSLWR